MYPLALSDESLRRFWHFRFASPAQLVVQNLMVEGLGFEPSRVQPNVLIFHVAKKSVRLTGKSISVFS